MQLQKASIATSSEPLLLKTIPSHSQQATDTDNSELLHSPMTQSPADESLMCSSHDFALVADDHEPASSASPLASSLEQQDDLVMPEAFGDAAQAPIDLQISHDSSPVLATAAKGSKRGRYPRPSSWQRRKAAKLRLIQADKAGRLWLHSLVPQIHQCIELLANAVRWP